jgi:hypothetical protein
LGMKEILQLFRRDAEYVAPDPKDGATSYTSYPVSGSVLQSREASGYGSGQGSREGSVRMMGRGASPPVRAPKRVVQEHPVYGRR